MFIYSSIIHKLLNYRIAGIVKDGLGNPIQNLYVDAYDSDFGTSADYIGKAVTDTQGKFEILFNDNAFKENFELLERKPDLFITVNDSNRLLYRSEVRLEAQGPEIFFEVNLKDKRVFDDPYANTIPRMISTFNSIGDTVDISQVDVATSLTQMIRALGNWSYYTTPKIMEFYGYPGPQVPRYPKRVEHEHRLRWDKERSDSQTIITPGTSSKRLENGAFGSLTPNAGP